MRWGEFSLEGGLFVADGSRVVGRGRVGGAVGEFDLVAEAVVAAASIDAMSAGPALAGGFPLDDCVVLDGGGAEFLAQVEVTTDAFGVRAIEAEHCFGVLDVHVVADGGAFAGGFVVFESELDGQ